MEGSAKCLFCQPVETVWQDVCLVLDGMSVCFHWDLIHMEREGERRRRRRGRRREEEEEERKKEGGREEEEEENGRREGNRVTTNPSSSLSSTFSAA